MEFHPIDLASWPRTPWFTHYSGSNAASFCTTVRMDITQFRRTLQERSWRFYPSLLYAIARIVNCHSEFRTTYSQGILGTYSHLDVGFTVFNPESETYNELWTEWTKDISTFLQRYTDDVASYQGQPTLFAKPRLSQNIFRISNNPWLDFTALDQNRADLQYDLLPTFTSGAFRTDNGQTTFPLAIQVHHAVCDGFHVARLIAELQSWFDSDLPMD